MAPGNRARRPLSLKQLDALPPGNHVIDNDMDIATKRGDGLWEGYEMGPIPSTKLIEYGPIRTWTGLTRP